MNTRFNKLWAAFQVIMLTAFVLLGLAYFFYEEMVQ